MEVFVVAFLAIIALAVGAAAAWLLRGREVSAERERATRAEASCIAFSDALQQERVALAGTEATLAAERQAHHEKLAELTSLRGDIETKLQALAAEALRGNEASFLRLAEQAFERHKEAAANLLTQKEQAITALLAPMATSLEAYRQGLGGFENAWREAQAVLTSEVQNVSAQAKKLANALQASPKTRGRWGEQQLQNVIELAGMSAHVDYTLQQTIEGEVGRLRPDCVIRVPGDRRIVVDAKTPLTAYLDAVEEVEDELREAHLRRHAQQLRTHMKQLADKRYWEALLPLTPDYVVMFIPGENFYAAALERDPQLFEDAIAARVLIVTPTTLIALAKAIAAGWRQEKMAEHARHVAELGRDLYRRLATMGGHIVQVGGGLSRAVEHYNKFVGSLEGSVMPQARRFNELAVEGTHEALPELRPIEVDARQPVGRDVILAPVETARPKDEQPQAAD
ncbi:MAG TPA: DNA recombination protein RmuC [Stellaceae bacterium]|jgi:DNA recombination protein RmuC|nr:DNA recombination protein RmuC [Stellaceae bacterium]